MKKYGKSNIELIRMKDNFFSENDSLVEDQLSIGKIYSSQAKRKHCKLCNYLLDHDPDFIKQDIPYVTCKNCTHLNGVYDDSEEFAQALYTEDKGIEYSKNYFSENLDSYKKRAYSIYLPKVEFLFTSLTEQGLDVKDIDFCDFGCGSGYLLYCLNTFDTKSLTGFEVSESQKEIGNKFIGADLIESFDMDNSFDVIDNIKAEVICLIGVLEHLMNPRGILTHIKNNDNIKYIYLSVPTYSLSTYLEVFSQEVFSRQLSCGHTHLYTEDSLNYLANEFGFEIISEWWFGTDMVDLYRHFLVTFRKSGHSEYFIQNFKDKFIPLIDCMQQEIDKQNKSSEVHLVLKL